MAEKYMREIMRFLIAIMLAFVLIFGCVGQQPGEPQKNITPLVEKFWPNVTREASIPATAVKMTPENDSYPPILHSDEWNEPVPLSPPVNTAGAEDSPFISPDGNTLYFFFTPDVSVPVEKQVLDNVTGIWVSKKQNGIWSEPQRVWLQDPGKLSLDGCEFVQGNTIWFCAAREGYTGIHWFTAEFRNGIWQDWKNADFSPDYKVGELHMSSDGMELYFHSDRTGGKGGMDIWVSENESGKWQEPQNLEILNTADNEGWPYLTQDGKELWFLRFYQGSPALFRSKRVNGTLSEPELIVSQFAGEPTLDNAGNLYFVHHFYKDGKMIEADIYVAYRK